MLPLFGEQHIVAFVWCTTAAKLGLAGVSMGWYLRRRFCLARPQALALALCYAFSTWTQTQMRNPQWLDALVLTPLAFLFLLFVLELLAWSHAEKPEHALRAVLQRGGLLAASLALGLGLSAARRCWPFSYTARKTCSCKWPGAASARPTASTAA